MDVSRNPEFLPHDGPLREDVHHLGALVGQVLIEQEGKGFYEEVEAIRKASIDRRRQGEPIQLLSQRLSGFDAEQAQALARAFSMYFQAVNMAEMVHRIRRRRDYQRADARPQPESLLDIFGRLKETGVTAEELLAWIGRTRIEPVFTAHPTEAMRRSLLDKQKVIVTALIHGFDAGRTPQERKSDRTAMLTALSAAWQTAESAPTGPSVQDEHAHVSYYLANPLYRVVPSLYAQLGAALEQVYGCRVELPRLLSFATWVGGDMDGNPNVGADTMEASLSAQRISVLDAYQADLQRLAGLLSQTRDRVSISADVEQRLAEYAGLFPAIADTIRPRHRNMPYRSLLTYIDARIEATREEAPGAYADPETFCEDLRLIEDSLRGHRGEHAGARQVRRLLRRALAFGFHLARLDVRQDSRVHDDALAVLLQRPDWTELPATERAALLGDYAGGQAMLPEIDDPTAARLQAVFVQLGSMRRRYGAEAVGLYIISMARSAADVLAVLALARRGGMADAEGQIPLDIAPLFEIVDDLRSAADTLRALLADPVYRAHLRARGDRQWIMLGYSDSGKDSGTLAARWAVQRAQVELLEAAREGGIEVAFFHGRGGSASRGGGRITQALESSPRGSVAGMLRVTEQGEVINRKYGIRALALRNLEQSLGAVLRASLRPRQPDPRAVEWRNRMTALSAWSREHYRKLVDHPDFVSYFRTATPIDVIEQMALGSRPSRRRSMRGVQDLRAIPWVFAWTQCRSILTGWYGLGFALQRGVAEFGIEPLQIMARDWPFFANMLEDIEMVLAKCDLDIAEAFSTLSGDLHPLFFGWIREEFERSRDLLLRIKGSSRLLQHQPRLAVSIGLRNPYVDPMSLLQVDLLRRWRAEGSEPGPLLDALLACVNGVSQGLQNTG
ncbi:phosphoenolpyruvate carboxylase [Frateuria aurantia]